MFNMGFTEIIVLGAIALIFIGPKQLPEVARTIAKVLNEFKRATSGITDSFDDIKHEAHSLRQDAEDRMNREMGRITDGIDEPTNHRPQPVQQEISQSQETQTTKENAGESDESKS